MGYAQASQLESDTEGTDRLWENNPISKLKPHSGPFAVRIDEGEIEDFFGSEGKANRRKTGKTDAMKALRAYRAGNISRAELSRRLELARERNKQARRGFAGRKRIWIAPYQKSDGSWVGGHHRWETPKARKARMTSSTAGRKRKK